MTETEPRKLPKRLRIDFRCKRPTYELYTSKGCTKRDLLIAGLLEETADALLWNSYGKKAMRYPLIRPEEWFWTDRAWWKEEASSPHLVAMYEISGGSFSDLSPPEQAELFGIDYFHMTGIKAKGQQWRNAQGDKLDIVRYLRSRLAEDGYDMAPAYPANINLMIKNHCKQEYGKDIGFIRNAMLDADELRRLARLSVNDVVNRPGEIWDRMPNYYMRFLNGFRSIKDFDKLALLETLRVVGSDVYLKFLNHYWTHQTYENRMTHQTLPPLTGRKDGYLEFFFVTQKANFLSNVSGFMRDYALPLGFRVGLIQLSPDVDL